MRISEILRPGVKIIPRFVPVMGLMGAFIPQNLGYYFRHPKGIKEMFNFLSTLNEAKCVNFVRMLLYYPFNSIKLVHNSKYVNAPWATAIKEVKGKRGSTKRFVFDLGTLNETYWKDLETFLEILHELYITPIISIMDFAQTHFKKHSHKSPYVLAKNNLQGVTMFDVDEFFNYLKPVLDKIKELYNTKRFYVELGNEYNFIDNRGDSSVLLKKIADYLAKGDDGIDRGYMLVPVGGIDKWHNLAIVSEHETGDKIKYKEFIPAIHFGTKEGWEKLKKDNGLRWMFRNYNRWMLSTDGARKRDNSPKSEVYWMRKFAEYVVENPVFSSHQLLLFELQPQIMWGPEKPSFDNVILGHYKLDNINVDWLTTVARLSPFKFPPKSFGDMKAIRKLMKSAFLEHKPSFWERFKRWMKELL